MILAVLVPLLTKYWKTFAITLFTLLFIPISYYAGYSKGKNTIIRNVEHTVYVEVEKRYENANRASTKINQTMQRIRTKREANPINDERDSCLLTNDPFEKECL